MARNIQDVAIDEDGRETHPAFATVTITQSSHGGEGATLFQSDIQHHHTMRMVISQADRKRHLSGDTVHPTTTLVEVEFSQAQWAAVIASVGHGSGTPATLRRLPGHQIIPEVPYQPRTRVAHDEVRGAVNELLAEIKNAMAALEEAEDSKAGVVVRRRARQHLRAMINNASLNASFAVRRMEETAENVVHQVRSDIESLVIEAVQRHKIDQASLPQVQELLLIEAPTEDAEIVNEND